VKKGKDGRAGPNVKFSSKQANIGKTGLARTTVSLTKEQGAARLYWKSGVQGGERVGPRHRLGHESGSTKKRLSAEKKRKKYGHNGQQGVIPPGAEEPLLENYRQ